MTDVRIAALLMLGGSLIGCAGGTAEPVAIDPQHDGCAECRMLISDVRLGAELVAPGEEPRLFDDIGCLRAYLKTHPAPAGAAAYVADHLSGAWVPAGAAVYTQTSAHLTTMGSGILAHADAASRDRDPAAAGGRALHATDVLPLVATAGEVPR
jgi:copper chaperone NosL